MGVLESYAGLVGFIVIFIDTVNLREDMELSQMIRNVSLFSKLNEYSCIYQKEKGYYRYLKTHLEQDIEPFPENCAVCLANFEDKESVIKVNCQTMHVFHEE